MKEQTNESKVKQIKLKGNYCLNRAPELKNQLWEAIQNKEQVEVDLSQINKVDLSFLQILCSAHQNVSAQNKKMISDVGQCQAVVDLAKRAGFQMICLQCSQSRCFLKANLTNK